MASKIIEAAGGIVVRKGAGKLIAVVQRAKDDAWVLPRGKLKRDENPAAAARREVVEETGHRVEVHEYLGAITYRAGGRPKVVQFWRMEAERDASHELMKDIVAVEWLPLKAAVRRLSYPLEKLFLRHAAARALKKRRAEAKSGDAKSSLKKSKLKKVKSSKTKTSKKKSAKANGKAVKAAAKSRPAKASRPAMKTRKPGRPLRKPPLKAKTGKANSAQPKPSKRNKAERKADLKAERKAARKPDRKSGKPKKKSKGKKSGRDRTPGTPAADARADARSVLHQTESTPPVKTSAVPSLADRTFAKDEADERKTILQRMLGRLAG